MKKWFVRLTALLMAACMVFMLLPAQRIWAAETDSGTCGDNLTWELSWDGTLTISGTGDMYDYQSVVGAAPWNSYWDDIKKIVIQQGVTGIGDFAFQALGVTSVSIPDSVTKIGESAFDCCKNLTSITIPDSVTSIGNGAFGDCIALTDITLPKNLTVISGFLFSGCNNLTGVTIPYGVTSIGAFAFCWCYNLTYVDIPDTVTSIGSTAFSYCTSLTGVEIPDGVTAIASTAFSNCTSLTSIVIPDSVTEIDELAFAGSTALAEIFFASDAPSISEDAFAEVTATAYYPDGNVSWTEEVRGDYGGSITWTTYDPGRCDYFHKYRAEVTPVTCSKDGYTTYTCAVCGDSYVENYMPMLGHIFENNYCTRCGNPNIYIRKDGECGDNLTWTLTSDGMLTISGTGDMYDYDWHRPPWHSNKSMITTVVIESGVTGIGSYAFADHTSLTNISLPEGITSIGEGAFYYSAIKNIALPDSLLTIGTHAFYGSNLVSVHFGNSLTSIDDFAFFECYDLTRVIFPDSLTYVGAYAFANCNSLQRVDFGTGKVQVDSDAFVNCYNLLTIAFRGDAPNIASYAFYDVCARAYYPAENDTWTADIMTDYGGSLTWKEYDPASCNDLCQQQEEVTPPTCTQPGYTTYTCMICGESYVDNYTELWPHEFVDGHCVVCGAKPVLYSGKCGDDMTWTLTSDGTLTVSGTGRMRNFYYVDSAPWHDENDLIKTVVIENGVTTISSFAFTWCENLTSVTIPDTVTYIHEQAFGCSPKLTDVTLPPNLVYLGQNAFAECVGLTQIDIPESVTQIGACAFYGCTQLADITISKNVTKIGRAAFGACNNLNGIWVDSDNPNFSSDSNGVLFNKRRTVLLMVPGRISSHYVIPERVTAIDAGAFMGCLNLNSVVIPDHVTSIGESAFAHCENLVSIDLGNGVTTIGEDAFASCISLSSVVIPDSVAVLEMSVFGWCTNLTHVTIGTGVTELKHYVFNGCTSLTQVIFKGSAPTIYSYSFLDANATAYYPGNDSTWTAEVMQDYGGIHTWIPYELDNCDTIHRYKTEITPPTCIENGYTTYTCVVCGDSFVDDYVAVSDHSYEVSVVESTCVEFGSTIYTCAVCGDSYTERRELGDHTYEGVITEPTCTQGGYTTFTCIHCGESFVGDYTEVRHAFVDDVCTICGHEMVYMTGVCGDNLTWKLDEEGCLVISGSGEIWEKAFEGWTDIKSIVFSTGVTSLGHYAFKDCTGIEEVTFPANITCIGGASFQNCTNLTRVTFLGHLETMYNYAFQGCQNLEEVFIRNAAVAAFEERIFNWMNLLDHAQRVYIESSIDQVSEFWSKGFLCTGVPELTQVDGISYNLYTREIHNLITSGVSATCTQDGYTDFECLTCGYTGTITHKSPGHQYNEYYICTVCDFLAPYVVDCNLQVSDLILRDGAYYTAYGYAVVIALDVPLDWLNGYPLRTYVESFGEMAFSLRYWEDLMAERDKNGLVPLTPTTMEWILDVITANPAWGEDETYLTHYLGFIPQRPDHFHEYTTQVTEPTCTQDGYTTHTCTICGVSFVSDYIEGHHEYVDGICTICGHSNWPLSGICGENLTWTLTADGVLTISGTGAMYDYSPENPAPWYSVAHLITTIIIDNGVTSIGSYAFAGCINLTAIDIDDDVSAIGSNAFHGCANLTDITLPDGLDSVGSDVFGGCTGLTQIVLPNGVTRVEDNAFAGCTDLEQIVIPEGVIEIGTNAFYGCDNLTDLVLPSTITTIGDYAFYGCVGIGSITIPASVISIGISAFHGCTNLTVIIFMGDAPVIGENAFCDVVANAYYPGKNPTWTQDVMQDYGGDITWISYDNPDCYQGHDYEGGFCANCGQADPDAIVYGDVNGDGRVDGRDLLKLKRYLADLDDETGESTDTVAAGADVNGDGRVDGRDLLKLRRYLANLDDETGESTETLGP